MGLFNRSTDLIFDFEEICRKQQVRIDELEGIISNLNHELQYKNELERTISKLNNELQHKDDAFRETITQVYNEEFKPLQDKLNQLEKDNKLLKAAGKKVHETNKELALLVEELNAKIDNKEKEIIRLQKEIEDMYANGKIIINDSTLINIFNARYVIDDSIYYEYRDLLEASKVLLDFYYKHKESCGHCDDTEINNIFMDNNDKVSDKQTNDISGQEMFLKRLNEIYKKH